MIDTDVTNEAIRLVDKAVNKSTDIREDSKKVYEFVKSKVKLSDKITFVFNNQNINSEGYIAPVKGIVYREFGEETKRNGVKIFYKGVDILTRDTKVKSLGDGLVIKAGENGMLGKYVEIEYGEFKAVYGKLNKIDAEVGKEIRKGEIIGRFNRTYNQKKLLHLEIWKDDTPIDPLEVIHLSVNNAEFR
ncbi:membrane protein [Caldisalinibacter kiritimatiensis]|uniref:Membrane protein n=2 Tax=Caldisalinibacter kiritimatiensis TaxID=1304284 RepID=R1CBY6_9FIRM|nr:membrane protein [Caldisalinibacter kiritimatiensis]